MTLEELQKKQRECSILNVSMQHQFEGVMKLFESAAILPNYPAMNTYRENLHTLLDARLDNTSSLLEFVRQLTDLQK